MGKWAGYWTLVLIFGSGFLFINIASDQMQPLELTALRMTVATIILMTITVISGKRLPTQPRRWVPLLLLGVINYTIPFTLITWAQQQGVDSGLSGVLIATNPLFTLLIAHLTFADEKMHRYTVIGMILGFFGAAVLALRNFDGGSLDLANLAGQAAIVLSALSFAVTNVFSRVALRDIVNDPIVVGTGATLGGMVSTVVLLGISLLLGTPVSDVTTLEGDTLLAIAVLCLVHSVLPAVLTKFVIREMGASRTATTTYIVPIVALFLGLVFLDEVIDGVVLVGTMIILAGVAVSNLKRPDVPVEEIIAPVSM